MRRMIPINSLLKEALGSREVMEAARAVRILRRWPEIVGPQLAERSWPDRFDHGTVWVAVQGSAWAQELRMMKEIIVERMNEMANEPNLFHNVRFGVRPLKKPKPDPEEPTVDADRLADLTIREIAERRLKKWKQNS